MPDCRTDEGTLEYLLKTLVARGDPLWPHAEAYTDEATARAAERLLMMSEQLRFLQFDVQREKFNPNTVFQPTPAAPAITPALVGESTEVGYNIHWIQLDDFWRDERNKYRANTVNRCDSL